MEELGFEPKAFSSLTISHCLLTCLFFISHKVIVVLLLIMYSNYSFDIHLTNICWKPPIFQGL